MKILTTKKNGLFLSLLALLTFITIGLAIYKDYGLSSDEPVERNSGLITYKYLGERFNAGWILKDPEIQFHEYLPPLQIHFDRDYPVGFVLPIVAAERLLGIGKESGEQEIYFFRHLFTFLANLIGVISIYALAKRRFGSWLAGLLSASFFIFSPRFFAELFYNSKDVIFMSFFALATYTAISFILKPSFRNFIFHAIASAIAIDVRVMAVMIPIMTVILILLRICKRELRVSTAIPLTLLYVALLVILVITFWPWLWGDPWGRFVESFQNMAKFSRGPGDLFYFGEITKTNNLPWHYIPILIVITTPILYVALFLVGGISTMRSIFQRHIYLWSDENELQDLIFLSLFVCPIVAVIVLKSTLYDGWRQMYFIYPAFLMISIKGWILIWKNNYSIFRHISYKILLIGITGISMASTALWMIEAHPLQNVYFNLIAGKKWVEKFDVDYWGLSHRHALEAILRDNNSGYITVWNKSYPKLGVAMRILNKNDRQRLVEVKTIDENPDYIVSTYRLDPTDYSVDGNYQLLQNYKIGDEIIYSIYRIRDKAKPSIKLRDTLNFASSSLARSNLRLPGWSHIEPWGIWSDGTAAQLIFGIPKDHPKSLTLTMRAFVTPQHPTQEFALWVNGAQIQEVVLTQGSNNQITIPMSPAMIETGSLDIQFKFKNPARPKDYGVGDDSRLLAIGLESAVFH